MTVTRWSRRGLLQTTAAAGSLIAAPWVAKYAVGQSAFDWKRFNGEKIEVLHAKGPRADLFQKYEKEFTELTGIQVGSESIPEQQARQKTAIEFSSGSTSFDVVMLALHVQKRLAWKGKWLSDLRPMLADPSMTAPEFDFADFSKAGLLWATQADGKIDTLPINIDYHLIYANMDLFEKKGVAYPKTFDEMIEAAKKLHDPSAGVTAWVGRGLKNANVPVWTNLLLGWDAETVDSSGKLMADSAEAIAAAELYKRMNVEFGPAGSSGYNWMESQALFMQGKAAMWLDGIGFAVPVEDKTKSRVAGRVKYVQQPKGPKAQHAGTFADGMGVSAFSKKQGPAYYYAMWAAGKKMQGLSLQTGAGAPCRNSVYSDPAILAGTTSSKGVIDAIVEAGPIGRPSLPVIIPVTEFRDIYGVALTNMINGGDVKAELAKATEQFKPVLEKSERA